PLDNLRSSKDITADWGPKHDQALDRLKYSLVHGLPLCFPDFTKPFCVATDASNVGIGAVLYQDSDKSDVVHYISIQARSLTSSEQNYSATKKELLAIIFALRKFHHYI